MGPRTRPSAPSAEQHCPKVTAGSPLFQYTMTEAADIHPTDGRRRREKGPPSGLALPRLERVSDTERGHSEDSAGEKEAKRQRSQSGTPVSTPRRMPYEYDAMMGITRVGTREAEGFDEDLDSTEYHDANDTTEETTRKGGNETDAQEQKSTVFQGGYGSASLKECIDLLNATSSIAPAPLDSGVGKPTDPLQFFASQANIAGFRRAFLGHFSCEFRTAPGFFASHRGGIARFGPLIHPSKLILP